jgi:glycosyltransferase involved in cell wall biosynthesis
MKILHVTDASSAGVLASVTTLARAQSVHPFVDAVTFAYVRRPDSPVVHEIQRLTGPKVVLRQLSASVGPDRFVSLTKHLLLAPRSEHYDVIHLHSSRSGLLGRLATQLTRTGDRVVYSPHFFAFARNDLDRVRRTMYLSLERIAAACSARYVVVSDSEAALATAVCPHASVELLPNVVDNADLRRYCDEQEQSSTAQQNAETLQSRLVVHIGRITDQKAPGLFTAAIRSLDRALLEIGGGHVQALWLGDGNRQLLHDRHARIQISGWLDSEALRQQIARANVVLFTSLGEGMPMALLESQALGIPIVASNVAGVTDVVRHGITGFLGDTADELAHHVERLLTEDALAKKMRHAAQQRSVMCFDVKALAERSLSAYSSLSGG